MSIIACLQSTKQYFDSKTMKEKYNLDDTELDDIIKKNFQGWSYDLGLGEEVYISSEDVPRLLSQDNPYVTIKPGEFALLLTYEFFKIPKDIMAFISVKFTYKKQGLINVSGFHVDPNYKGRIIFSVYNAGPSDIVLKYKEPVFMIFFQEIEKCQHLRANGPRHPNCKEEYEKKCIKQIDGHEEIPSQLISQIKGQSATLADNHQKIEKLEHDLKLCVTIGIGVITTLLGVILTLAIPKISH